MLLEMHNISKAFPGVKALDEVSFNLKSGEVHALLGENGAGKSTLMKILFGIYQCDKGEIFLESTLKSFRGSDDSYEEGVRLIPQELNLIPNLSVAENIFAGHLPTKIFGFVDWNKIYKESEKTLIRLGSNISSRKQVSELSVSEQQLVAIARAFQDNPKIIVFDEPTSALSRSDTDKLFDLIRILKNQDIGIIYISHRLEEIPVIADRVTVMRDGKIVQTVDKCDINMPTIVKALSGIGGAENRFPEVPHEIKNHVKLSVRNLNYKNIINNVSFNVMSGEILGITGFVGAGKTELSKLIFGYYRPTSGRILLDGKEIELKSTKDAIDNKIALIPEDRRSEGLVISRGVDENITLANLKSYIDTGFIKKSKEKNKTNEYIESLSVATTDIKKRVKYLSGGNQQKIVVSKWLDTGADIYIFDEATRGIDINSKSEIYKIMGQLAAKGKAVINISMEFPEILGVCDRILVMHAGEITADLPKQEATLEKMFEASGGIRI